MGGGDDGLPQQYNASMAYHKLGYAFYDPESSLVVKPGTCGYIDESGSWHPMVDICGTGATNAGYEEINRDDLITLPPWTRLWGPKFTETVTSQSSSIKAGAPLPVGIPAKASALVEFTLDSEFGAVLLCKGEVTKQGYYHSDPFRVWARDNSEKLLATFPAIRKYGFYVVTTTFTAKEVLVNAWRNKSNKLALGFGGGVESVAEISASTEIYGADSASGWIRTICQEREGNEEKVVFFGGLNYKYRTLTGWMRKARDKFEENPLKKWRGEKRDNLLIQDPEDGNNAVEIDESEFGEKSKF